MYSPCAFPSQFTYLVYLLTIFLELLLLTEWQTANARNDRDRISRARQVAEDLFKPRQQTASADAPTSGPDVASSTEHQPRREPRIFAIPPQRPIIMAKVQAPPTRTRSGATP